ncbi:MAG: HlyD family secretion protein [Bryobacteraceae bacterium]|nr:HlyD family secretion protein [Bryobacteraceae bacterium]
MVRLTVLILPLLLASCDRPATVVKAVSATAPVAPASKSIRSTGLVRAVKVSSIQVPQIAGQGGRMTLVRLVPNGTHVKEGDTLAEFDRTKQLDDALEAEAKFDDLGHQVRQKIAANRSEAEKRLSELKQAEADLAKAEIQLKKGPILSEIDRAKNQAKADSARARVESLGKIHAFRNRVEAAALRIIELQQERQKVALERAKSNAEKLIVKAPLAGMVALENIWRGGSMGHAQEGDQLWNGQPMLKLFDPAEMEVHAQFGEPDGAALRPGARARVRLDAYPEVEFEGRFESASPVASSALGSPIKNFAARFRLLGTDPRLLPDLSAAVVIE